MLAPMLLRSKARTPFIHTLKRCGLANPANLMILTDAGDIASAPNGSSNWHDLSGNGIDLTLPGTGSNPTLFGTPGNLSANEFWGVNGTSTFFGGGGPAFYNTLHKRNAIWGFLAWINLGSIAANQAQTFFATYLVSNSWAGVGINIGTLDVNSWTLVMNTVTGGALALNWAGIFVAQKWLLYGVSINDVTGAGVEFISGKQRAFNATYNAPSAASCDYPTGTYTVVPGGTGTWMSNGSAVGSFMFWNGIAPTGDQFAAIYDATRTRYGV